MKTTIEISDSLLDEAKRLAAKEGTTVAHTWSRVSGESSRNEKVAGCFGCARRHSRARDFSPEWKMQRGNESVKRFTRKGADEITKTVEPASRKGGQTRKAETI